jgi:hypothetical protein
MRFTLGRNNATHVPNQLAPSKIVPGLLIAGGDSIGLASSTASSIVWSYDATASVSSKQILRAGSHFQYASLRDQSTPNAFGTLIYDSIADYVANQPIEVTQFVGAQAVSVSQAQLAAYFSHAAMWGRGLSTSVGVRVERENIFRTGTNWGPRGYIELSRHRGTMSLGIGRFFNWLDVDTERLLKQADGAHGATEVSTLSDNNASMLMTTQTVSLAPRLVLPKRTLVVASLSSSWRQLASRLNYTYITGDTELRLTYPSQPTDATYIAASIGHMRSHRVQAGFDFRAGKAVLRSTYNWRASRDNGDSHLSVPPNVVSAEDGPASDEVRHSLTASTTVSLLPRLRVAPTITVSSGLPFTPLLSVDVNRDGFANDRPAGVGRNAARLPYQSDLSIRTNWTPILRMKTLPGDNSSRAPGRVVELFGVVRNVLNRQNVLSLGTAIDSASFRRPLIVSHSRVAECGFRIQW